MPSMLRLQILIFILGSPLLTIAAYQSSVASRPTTFGPLPGLAQFLQFGALFEINLFAVSSSTVTFVASIFVLFLALFLLTCGFLNKRSHEGPEGENEDDTGPPSVIMVTTGLFVFLCILLFMIIAHTFYPSRTTKFVVATSILPVGLPFIDFWLRRHWEQLLRLGMFLNRTIALSGSLRSLNFFLAVLPVTIIAAISLFNPILILRGTLLFLPYLIIVLGIGLASLVYRDKRWVALVLMLVIIHWCSVLHYEDKPPAIDYKSLAERWIPRISNGDLIFVHGRGHPADWAVAPIFYYLKAEQYHFVGREFSKEVLAHPYSRVWVLSFPGVPMTAEMIDALMDYHVEERVEALNLWTDLYKPSIGKQ